MKNDQKFSNLYNVEVECLRQLHHMNITKLVDFDEIQMNNKTYKVLVLELAKKGELF